MSSTCDRGRGADAGSGAGTDSGKGSKDDLLRAYLEESGPEPTPEAKRVTPTRKPRLSPARPVSAPYAQFPEASTRLRRDSPVRKYSSPPPGGMVEGDRAFAPTAPSVPTAAAGTAVATQAAPVRRERPPIVLGGKYRIERLVASGGLGEVFEGVHEVIGRRVAVKMIRHEFSDNPELSARFLQEARAASAVGHPGIVQVFDVGVSPDGRTYLVMEFMEGEDLLQVLRRERRLAAGEAAAICSDVLDILAATHDRGILHRDLKPENVFLARGPRGLRWVKLLDFGVAQLAGDKQTVSRLTQPGTAVGTPYYMAPEQARASTDLDARVDIYAVGVVLYELLTGRLPFEGKTYNEVLAKVLGDPFPSPRETNPDVPPELEAIILRATARKPTDRYATARDFAAALEPFRARQRPAAPAAELQDDVAAVPDRREGIGARQDRSSPAAMRAASPVPGVRPDTPMPPGAHDTGDTFPRMTSPERRRSPATPSPHGVPRVLSPAAAIEAQGGPPRGRQIGVFLAGVALAAGLVLGGVFVGHRLRDEPSWDDSAPAARPVRSEAVRVRLLHVPDDAEVRVDGLIVGSEFDLPRSDAEHVLEIRVGDHPVLVRTLRADRDTDIDFLAPPPASPNGSARESRTVPASDR